MSRSKSNATRRAEQTAAAERAAAIRQQQERAERRRRAMVVTAAVVAVFALVLGIGYAVQSTRDTTGEQASLPSGVVDRYAVPRGDASAPVTVTVYEDFMCPFCGAFEAAAGPMLDRYVESGDARILYRPLSFLDHASNGTEYSTRATNALAVVLDTTGPEAAGQFHDLLFDNQPAENTDGLTDERLVELAVQAGATESEVSGPIRNRKFEQWVVNANDAADQEGVHQTPTVQVDGETVQFATTQELVAALERAIQAG
jgi:protein-disulfide isomerase